MGRRPGKYTQRPPIDNLKRSRDDFEYGRGAPNQLSVGFDPNWLLTRDLDPAGRAELNLAEPPMSASIQHG